MKLGLRKRVAKLEKELEAKEIELELILSTTKKKDDILLTYSKIIEGIDDYYHNTIKKGSKKQKWVINNWKQLSKQLVEVFVEMVEEGSNTK